MIRHVVPLAALLIPAAAAAQTAQDIGPLTDVPNLVITYYDVSGSTPDQIRQSINAQRGVDPADGKPVDAFSHWYLHWSWQNDANGQCQPQTVVVTYKAELRMPRLADEAALPPEVQQGWDRYMAALQLHESGHLLYVSHRVADLQAAMRAAATCDAMRQTAADLLAGYQQHDRDYDAETGHGATQGAVYP